MKRRNALGGIVLVMATGMALLGANPTSAVALSHRRNRAPRSLNARTSVRLATVSHPVWLGKGPQIPWFLM